jgi:hypothetical protein
MHELVRHGPIIRQGLFRGVLAKPHSCKCRKAIDVAPCGASQHSAFIRNGHHEYPLAGDRKLAVILRDGAGSGRDPLDNIAFSYVEIAGSEVDLDRRSTDMDRLR